MWTLILSLCGPLLFPAMFFLFVFCYFLGPISCEILAYLTVQYNSIWITRASFNMLLNVCSCVAYVSFGSTCTKLARKINSWSMNTFLCFFSEFLDTNFLLHVSHCIVSYFFFSSSYNISCPLLPFHTFVLMVLHPHSCIKSLFTLNT